MKLFFCTLLFSSFLYSQTKANLQEQTKLVVNEASLIMSLPNNAGFIPVILDSSLSLIFSNGVYRLVVNPPPAQVPSYTEDKFKTPSEQNTFGCSRPFLGNKTNITVYYNGILQREVEDYAFTQNGGICTITFNRQIPPEQLITIRYPSN